MKKSNILRSAVAAGQVEQVIPLGRCEPSKWWRSKCKKRIKADEHLQWHHGNVTTPHGITVPGFAFWLTRWQLSSMATPIVIANCACAVPATAFCTPFRCPSQSASSSCRTSSWQTMSWRPTGTSRTVSRRSRRRSLPR